MPCPFGVIIPLTIYTVKTLRNRMLGDAGLVVAALALMVGIHRYQLYYDGSSGPDSLVTWDNEEFPWPTYSFEQFQTLTYEEHVENREKHRARLPQQSFESAAMYEDEKEDEKKEKKDNKEEPSSDSDFRILSLFGYIFDVSRGSEFYGAGATYELFLRHESTRSMVLASMNISDLDGGLDDLFTSNYSEDDTVTHKEDEDHAKKIDAKKSNPHATKKKRTPAEQVEFNEREYKNFRERTFEETYLRKYPIIGRIRDEDLPFSAQKYSTRKFLVQEARVPGGTEDDSLLDGDVKWEIRGKGMGGNEEDTRHGGRKMGGTCPMRRIQDAADYVYQKIKKALPLLLGN